MSIKRSIFGHEDTFIEFKISKHSKVCTQLSIMTIHNESTNNEIRKKVHKLNEVFAPLIGFQKKGYLLKFIENCILICKSDDAIEFVMLIQYVAGNFIGSRMLHILTAAR